MHTHTLHTLLLILRGSVPVSLSLFFLFFTLSDQCLLLPVPGTGSVGQGSPYQKPLSKPLLQIESQAVKQVIGPKPQRAYSLLRGPEDLWFIPLLLAQAPTEIQSLATGQTTGLGLKVSPQAEGSLVGLLMQFSPRLQCPCQAEIGLVHMREEVASS